MKTVFSDISTIAHLWANKVQSEARNRGNFFFDTDTIYSYGRHFPIAKHVTNERGENAVLFTERNYSVTTAKHIITVRQAAHHLNIIYCYSPNSNHAENFKFWLNQAETQLNKLSNARKPELYLNELSRISDKVNKYAAFYNAEIPESLQVALSIKDKKEYAHYSEKKLQAIKNEEKRQKIELRKKHRKEVKDFLAGKIGRLYTHNGTDLLRMDEDNVRTSQAVTIPVNVAKKIYEKLAKDELKVGDKIVHYEVNEVSDIVRVGCHTFKRDYLIEFGQKYLTA